MTEELFSFITIVLVIPLLHVYTQGERWSPISICKPAATRLSCKSLIFPIQYELLSCQTWFLIPGSCKLDFISALLLMKMMQASRIPCSLNALSDGSLLLYMKQCTEAAERTTVFLRNTQHCSGKTLSFDSAIKHTHPQLRT